MNRELSEGEKNVLNLFKDQLTLKESKECSQISLSVKKQKVFVSSPRVYEIEGTDSVLILGEPRQAINIDMLRRLYEEQLKHKGDQVHEQEEVHKEGDQVHKEEGVVQEQGEEVHKEGVVHKEEVTSEMKDVYVKMVQSQFDLPREEVEKILEENDYDVVNH